MLDERWADARNLLLVRLDNIGDVVLLSAAIRNLRERLPDARLTLMASPAGAKAVPLLPWLDDLMVWRAIWQDVGGKMPLDPGRELQLVDDLRERQFDAAVIFTSFSQSPHAPAYACYLAGIPLRLGESKEFGGGLLTTEIRNLPDDLYQGERALRLLEGVGFPIVDRRPRVVVPSDAAERGRALLSNRGVDPSQPYLVVQPGASCQARRYPLERFGALAGLLERRLGISVLLTGSDKEAPELEEIASQGGSGLLSLAGQTSVGELAAIVEGARLVVCNDSLPMHLSAVVDTPSLVLFSGTDLESQWRSPYSPTRLLRRPTRCSPCYRFQCPFAMECLEIPPEEAADSAEALLADVGEGLPHAGGSVEGTT
jgi:ADP-heptose:LPS heptosyltransferase